MSDARNPFDGMGQDEILEMDDQRLRQNLAFSINGLFAEITDVKEAMKDTCTRHDAVNIAEAKALKAVEKHEVATAKGKASEDSMRTQYMGIIGACLVVIGLLAGVAL